MSDTELSLIHAADLTELGRQCYFLEVNGRKAGLRQAGRPLPPKSGSAKRGAPRAVVLALALIVGLGLFVAWQFHQPPKRILSEAHSGSSARFSVADLRSYATIVTPKADEKDEIYPGKLLLPGVIVVTPQGLVHAAYSKLPEPLRAQAPSEVQTVAVVGCRKVNVGTYSVTKRKALAESCSVVVVEEKSGARIATNTFWAYPPSNISGERFGPSGDVTAYLDPSKIANWIAALQVLTPETGRRKVTGTHKPSP